MSEVTTMTANEVFSRIDEAAEAAERGLTREDLEPYGHGVPTGKHDVSDRVLEAWRRNAGQVYEAIRLWNVIVSDPSLKIKV
jgi:hypothetical protein